MDGLNDRFDKCSSGTVLLVIGSDALSNDQGAKHTEQNHRTLFCVASFFLRLNRSFVLCRLSFSELFFAYIASKPTLPLKLGQADTGSPLTTCLLNHATRVQ
jgi:hypothetical protein